VFSGWDMPPNCWFWYEAGAGAAAGAAVDGTGAMGVFGWRLSSRDSSSRKGVKAWWRSRRSMNARERAFSSRRRRFSVRRSFASWTLTATSPSSWPMYSVRC
jgi:hypothetical protein